MESDETKLFKEYKNYINEKANIAFFVNIKCYVKRQETIKNLNSVNEKGSKYYWGASTNSYNADEFKSKLSKHGYFKTVSRGKYEVMKILPQNLTMQILREIDSLHSLEKRMKKDRIKLKKWKEKLKEFIL